MQIVRKIFLYSIHFIFYLLSYLPVKRNDIWVFGSWFAKTYSDNSRYLFEYICTNRDDIFAVWITDSDKVLKQLRAEGKHCFKRYSPKAFYYGLRAKVSVFVQSNNADGLWFMNNTKVKHIQLWHGAPLKKIGYDDFIYNKKKPSFFSQLLDKFFPFRKQQPYALMIALSHEDKNIFASAFQQDRIEITGYPRNDLLVLSKPKNRIKTICYFPTFRGEVGSEWNLFLSYGFATESWEKFLEEENAQLHIKLHPANDLPQKDKQRLQSSGKIRFIESDEDVTELMMRTDILITDYSSLFFDFVLTERPIIFAPFDYDAYVKQERQFYFDYDAITPGPKCKNWEEVLQWAGVFLHKPYEYKKARIALKKRFHHFSDAQSAQRVTEAIWKTLK
jgi:CDP-glycerol glycerophosphotransferase